MIIIEVTPLPETEFLGACDHRVTAEVAGVKYAARSRVPQSALRSVINQLAEYCDDQPVVVMWPTIEMRHRSLWDLAGVRNREEHQMKAGGEIPRCAVCHGPITGRATTCSARCRKRASRARSAA